MRPYAIIVVSTLLMSCAMGPDYEPPTPDKDDRYRMAEAGVDAPSMANLPWWERLDRAASAHKVHWEWTRGHAGHILQEAADNAARRIAAAGRVDKSILEDAELSIGTVEAADLRG